ncbi:MAG TPA: A24 family peptidase [Myxococcota bacterium]|nr:A24 family peptidase [Myxococcota bacterium]HRY94795.1 A24 family peptidase [Myxococcota bacterium]
MGFAEIALDGLLLLVCAAGAFTDLRRHVIPDWLTFPAIGLGLLLRGLFFGLGGVFDAGLVSALFGGVVGFLVFGLFAIWGKGMGGGDVKLMTAVGALAGFLHGLTCVMCTALVGAVLALGLLLAKRKLLSTAKGLWRRVFTTPREGEDRITLPYGLPIALGVVWATLIKYGILAGF